MRRLSIQRTTVTGKSATRWMMENVRKKAIRRLCSLRLPDEIEKIRCGRDYRYPPWVRKGIFEIVQRESPVVTEVEGQYLGLRDALRCAAAREFYRPRNNASASRNYYSSNNNTFDSAIFGGIGMRAYNNIDINSIIDAVFTDDIPKAGEGALGLHD
ncbi:hypothetical protein M422DRAFT_263671 [Sphaerobolus stellatus SS14]|uniref:Uncharacterized protein n=1 Tax=Sphaerobolus stellatus (strain SS14) TaxID=990650 RepID=A0A0C9UYJ1_SPHS4|nr:hypothetical protein M422DRAFT_263671 [Sphaerobolus stellatus SS14]